MPRWIPSLLLLLIAPFWQTGCSLIVYSDCGDEETNFCPPGYRCVDSTCVPGDAGCEDVTECDLATSDGCCPEGCTEFDDVDCCLEECCCPDETVCVEGLCREPVPEQCNGADDDFDGDVDEGFDLDGDGVSSCPFVDAIPDCNDNNEFVFPGHPEVCDGHDNDCDGTVDDGELCPSGQVCHQMFHLCVEHAPCPEHPCPAGEFCHTDGVCYPEEADLGDPCVRQSQCRWGRCIDTSALDIPGRHCTELCCDTSNCPPETWCADRGFGLKLCAPGDWFDGVLVGCPGDECPLCWQGGCRRQCCSDSECETACQLAHEVRTPAGQISTTICDARPIDGLAVGLYDESECGPIGSVFFSYCASGLRWVVEEVGGLPIRCVCTAPCRTHEDCTAGGADPDARCAATPEGSTRCYPTALFGELGDRVFGDECGYWEECASGACHPDGYCTEPCRTAELCPGASMCVPVQGPGGQFATLCTLP